MRDIDPFDYWEDHASAIEGLGGLVRSPDPRYLFHTRYHTVRAGHARFIVRLNEVRATFGELSVRVHAWKAESDSNVSLVSGARTLLYGKEGAEIVLPVYFAAQKNVLYALYGYLSEDSDVAAKALYVAIDEPEDIGELLPVPPRSVLAMGHRAEETRHVNALLHYGTIESDRPVSQSCTVEQIDALGLGTTGFLTWESAGNNGMVIAHWSERICLSALDAYGATDTGLEGLVVGPFSTDTAQRLARYTALTRATNGRPPSRTRSDFYDFLLMPGGPEYSIEGQSDARDRWETVERWLERLKVGGLAIVGLHYRPGNELVSSSAASEAPTLSRNEIGQWALRLIGSGYSVAPMAFAPVSELVVDDQGLAAFMLIIQRL